MLCCGLGEVESEELVVDSMLFLDVVPWEAVGETDIIHCGIHCQSILSNAGAMHA